MFVSPGRPSPPGEMLIEEPSLVSSNAISPEQAQELLKQHRMTNESWPTGRYVSYSMLRQWMADHGPICTTGTARQAATQLPKPEGEELVRLAVRFNNAQTAVDAQNDVWKQRSLEEHRTEFDAVGEGGLTANQREAIVTDGDITLVVAGAGTGKTTTIVEKVGYLLRSGLAKPHEILVLAYNKEAQLQLQARIRDRHLGQNVRAATFHAFGFGVVRSATDPGPEPVMDSMPRAFFHREINEIRHNTTSGTRLRNALESFRGDLASPEKFATFVSNILNFLNRYKTRRASVASLRRSARTQRQQDFVTLFEHLASKYEVQLHGANAIDFSDMIVRATDLIEAGTFVPRYKYILIDEFQDITRARWRLIHAVRRASAGQVKLFLVGDDWQSIYAFDDADVSIMTGLQDREQGVVRIDLDTTFRFPQSLADVSSRFIMRNPAQLKKTISSANRANASRPIVVHPYKESETGRSRESTIRKVVERIAAERPDSTVLVLGRYRKSIPDNWNELTAIAREAGINLTYHTCHAAKGLEADEVIVLDVNGAAMGFPCRIPDDEFIQLLPTPSEAFADAEERRLFYVSLTRTRGIVHLVIDETKPSSFLDDLSDSPSPPVAKAESKRKKETRQPAKRLEAPVDPRGRIPHCPSCNQPTFVKREGSRGSFWGCSDFPKCWGRPKKCPSCSELAYVLDSPHGNRYCAECGWPT
jgi:DNA helicase-4